MNLLTFISRAPILNLRFWKHQHGLHFYRKNQTQNEKEYKSKQLLATPPTVPSENASIQIPDSLRQNIEQVACATRAADGWSERERLPSARAWTVGPEMSLPTLSRSKSFSLSRGCRSIDFHKERERERRERERRERERLRGRDFEVRSYGDWLFDMQRTLTPVLFGFRAYGLSGLHW